jgi:D-ribose pyranose/furanose isomerase RbsD
MNKISLLFLIALFALVSCKEPPPKNTVSTGNESNNWKQKLAEALPLLGHRNWIVVADKALPEQNAAGIEYINTNEKLLPVLQYVLERINASGHVKPIIYRDEELAFITEEQAKGVKQFSIESQNLFGEQAVQTLLHDSAITKLDKASRLFKVLVLKTDETIPYSSVFLQLDCAYWDAVKEKQLRDNMNK